MKRFELIPQLFFNTADAGAGAASSSGGAAASQAAAGAAAAATGDGAAAAAAAAPGAGSAADANAGAAAAAAAAAPGGAAGDPAGAGAPAAGTGAAAAAAQVPERYELTIPQGSTLDQVDVDAITAIAKENKWSNEAAQAALQRMSEDLSAQSTRFLTELQADTEIGGANLERAQLDAKRALDKFLPANTPEGQTFRTAMNKSGYGNYAPFVKLLSRIGKAMGEDSPGAGGAGAGGGARRSHADVMFGDTATK
jgi:hypothetical protein